LDDEKIYENILEIIRKNSSDSKGISKTEVTRIYTEIFGTSKTTIWEYIFDLINSKKIELKKISKKQQALFILK
jgi:hypothetical protein